MCTKFSFTLLLASCKRSFGFCCWNLWNTNRKSLKCIFLSFRTATTHTCERHQQAKRRKNENYIVLIIFCVTTNLSKRREIERDRDEEEKFNSGDVENNAKTMHAGKTKKIKRQRRFILEFRKLLWFNEIFSLTKIKRKSRKIGNFENNIVDESWKGWSFLKRC